MSETYVVGLVARLPSGTTEIYFHPANDLSAAPLSAGRTEMQILESPRLREALINASVHVTSFAEIARLHRLPEGRH
jgi:hypothetical protein